MGTKEKYMYKSYLDRQMTKPFGLQRDKKGKLSSNYPISFFNGLEDKEHLTFSQSNNKVLMNMSFDGSLKAVSFFSDPYWKDGVPGAWVQCNKTSIENLSYNIRYNGNVWSAEKNKEELSVGYIDKGIPCCDTYFDKLKIRLISFAPRSNDKHINRCGIYLMITQNLSDEKINMTVKYPDCTVVSKFNDNLDAPYISYRNAAVNALGEGIDKFAEEQKNDLDPNETKYFACVFTSYGDSSTYDMISGKSVFEWLNETINFYSDLTGDFSKSEDHETIACFEMSVRNCIHAIVKDDSGKMVQSMMGTYPPGQGINTKDVYYTLLPSCYFNPINAEKGIEWLFKYSVRPKGYLYKGGINHSLGNTVAPIMLSGIYYKYNDNKEYFLKHPEYRDKIIKILSEVLDSREIEDVYLFPSEFISDGYSLYDYHTGSNVCAWFAFISAARLMRDIWHDDSLHRKYTKIAKRIKKDIESFCIVKGSRGSQYNEGVWKDGTATTLLHDGEESDVTLMPFYGFLDFFDKPYQNFAKFALSTENPNYSENSHGIVWERTAGEFKSVAGLMTESTAPGYIIALSGCDNKEDADRNLRELKSVFDINGSLLWWSYDAHAAYGQVTRKYKMQSGWAMGVFVSLYMTQFMGIEYDAPQNTLFLKSTFLCDSYKWEKVKLGNLKVSIEKTSDGKFSICNHNLNMLKIIKGENKEAEIKKGERTVL